MSFRIILQLGFALMLLIFSTGATLYEGSGILEDTWEWKYTAIFSQMKNGPVENVNDILPIDYFVYAAKFVPTFPLLMLLGGTYLIILLAYIFLRRKDKIFSYILSCIGVLYLGLSSFISKSPTIGLKIFFNSFLFIGILLIVIALLRIFNYKTKKI
ncbi:YjdJ family protein [Peribacillus sp. NPDC096379]|uniref:YjdJ family protein n=1 Tax=Peribacillus sp. NPDC096379 TaxID=3364393 RepID=UPI00381C7B0A